MGRVLEESRIGFGGSGKPRIHRCQGRAWSDTVAWESGLGCQ